jgi:hypothetical protein
LTVEGNDLVRLAASGDLRRVRHGVYALPAAFAGPREDLIAAWLRLIGNRMPWDSGPPPAVASHQTAAAIHGFGTFLPRSPTFTVLRRRFDPGDDSVHIYTARLDPVDWEWKVLPEAIRMPVTRPPRTIVDLAFAGEDRSHVLDALEDAREAGVLEESEVADALTRRHQRRGRGSAAWLAKTLIHE